MKAFRYQDEKSDKFWFIQQCGAEYAVTYGKWNTHGRCEIKEFADEEECRKQVDKQIAAKEKKGYKSLNDFDFDSRHYIDTEEYGPHILTSHPRFAAHFTEEFYYDCADEEAPFGSDEGSDTLHELEMQIKKNKDADITLFPRKLVEQDWGMPFYPPERTDKDAVTSLLSQPADSLPMEVLVRNSDLVIVATALGQIKVMGKVAMRLKDMALASLKRLIIIDELADREKSYTYGKMIEDLENFPLEYPEPSDTARVFINYLGCPCTVFKDLYDDDDMVYSFQMAAARGKKEGFSPVLIIVDDVLLEQLEMTVSPEDDGTFNQDALTAYRRTTLENAYALNVDEVLKELIGELDTEEDSDYNPHSTKFVKTDIHDSAISYWDFDTRLSQEVLLALIPTNRPWEIPAWIPMGGFNDCPEPERQVAIFKRWHDWYAAAPYTVSHDTWELLLPEPLANKEAAVNLAWEHYGFCSDRILQSGDGYTIGHLAYALMNSTVWYFWWD